MITIAAQAGHHPTLRRLAFRGAANWTVRGLAVSPSYTPPVVKVDEIVSARESATDGPTRDITLEDLEIFSVPDISGWGASDWLNVASDGFAESGQRILVRNSSIRNVWYGMVSEGAEATFDHNLIENFAGDGMRGLSNDSVYQYNTIRDAYSVNDEHHDGFQSWTSGPGGVGTGVLSGVTLRGNRIQSWTDENRPFLTIDMQGIGCFDGFFDGWVVENNVVVVDHWHGISFYGMKNSRVVNNTVVDRNSAGGYGPPWILIAKHKNGQPSENVLVRDNLAQYGVNLDPGTNVTEDHNLTVTNPSSFFVDAVSFDLHLRAGSPGIDTGIATSAPVTDIEGSPRPQGAAYDLGAYEYRQ
jgi:hypothetical protein